MAYKAKSSIGMQPRLRGENEPVAMPPHEQKDGVIAIYTERRLEGQRVVVISRVTHT